jgi:hypothetical protein
MQYFFVHPHMRYVGHPLVGLPDKDFTSLPEHADRPPQKQPAKYMRPAHHAFFNQTCRASDLFPQVGPQP